MWKRIFKAVWHDPVGSKVISGIILIPVAAIVTGLWSGSGFSFNGTAIWAGAKSAVVSFIEWTATTLPISRASLGMLICLGLLGWACAALMWLYAVKGRLERFGYRAVAVREGFAVKAPEAELPDPKELGETKLRIFKVLYRDYPSSVNLSALAARIGARYPECEQVCEGLETIGLIELLPASFNKGLSVVLSKAGRDFYLNNGLDLTE